MPMSVKHYKEVCKYEAAYQDPNYRMGMHRHQEAVASLGLVPFRGSYLDVGCGRGEMLKAAEDFGFAPVMGTEVVKDLLNDRVRHALAWDLPFGDQSVDLVSMWDVIEHLLPGDDEMACRELSRVAKRAVLISANNKPSIAPNGDVLHVNIRPYDEWHALFEEWFAPAEVFRIHKIVASASAYWRIEIAV